MHGELMPQHIVDIPLDNDGEHPKGIHDTGAEDGSDCSESEAETPAPTREDRTSAPALSADPMTLVCV